MVPYFLTCYNKDVHYLYSREALTSTCAVMSQSLVSQEEHASSALLATIPLGYKQGVGLLKQQNWADSSCPDLCPTWPGFKPILSSHYPQTYEAGQVVQVEGLFTSSCRWSMSSPSSPWIHSHLELRQVCRRHAYGLAAHTAIIHMEQHTYFTAYCYWSYHNEHLVLLLGPIKSIHQ